MHLKNNIRALEAFAAFKGSMFAVPILVLFYRDQMGLQFGDFMIADCCYMCTMLLLDVPTGWISDIWRRRTTLMAGMFFALMGWALMAFSKSLGMVVMCEIVMGVGFSLFSGTESALLYDTLLALGRTDEYVRLEGRRKAFGQYATAAASVAGGFMYATQHQLPFLMTVLMNLAGLLCVAAITEPARHKRRPEKHPLADMTETAKYVLHGHADVGIIILFSAVMFSACKIIMWMQQPYYMALHLHESLFGVLMAVGYGLNGLMNHLSHWIKTRFNLRQLLTFTCAVAVGVTAGAGVVLGLHGVALLMVGGSCLLGLTSPHISNFLNQRTDSDRRATALSTASMMEQLVFIPVSLTIGQILDHTGVQTGLIAISAWLAFAGGTLIWKIRKAA